MSPVDEEAPLVSRVLDRDASSPAEVARGVVEPRRTGRRRRATVAWVLTLKLIALLLGLASYKLSAEDAPASERADHWTFTLERFASAWRHGSALAGLKMGVVGIVGDSSAKPRMSRWPVDLAKVKQTPLISERDFTEALPRDASCVVRFKDPKMRLCHCKPDGGPNAGDLVGPDVVRKVVEYHFNGCSADGLEVSATSCFGSEPAPCLLSVGSVLEKAKAGDHVWGTGAWHNSSLSNIWKHAGAVVHGVRGPNTASVVHRIYDNEDGSDHLRAPAIGDPGFLVGFTHRGMLAGVKREGLCLIRHHSDLTAPPEGVREINTNQEWPDFVKGILGCGRVFSSSLHGLIFADAFSIPARWYQPDGGPTARQEGTWKYLDYLAVTPRALDPRWLEPSRDINEIFDRASFPPTLTLTQKRAMARRLVVRFPYDLFERIDAPSPTP